MERRRVCVVTGTRAEFGLLKWLMWAIRAEPGLELQCLVTGAHLETRFGMTVDEIEQAGISIDAQVPILPEGDTARSIAEAVGRGVSGIHAALEDLDPDILVILGDRFEALAAATAATIARIPIAHLHGGESTEGVIDEGIRHAVTKLSHLHFTSHAAYRTRVLQLGESPGRVWDVGALGAEAALRTASLADDELARLIGRPLEHPCLLITLHPLTLDSSADGPTADALLAALEDEREVTLIFTLPNADHNNDAIRRRILEFAHQHENAVAIPSLGQRGYLSVMRRAEAVVGNSSSGIIEAPSVGVASIDIGERQRGRIRAPSVIHCEPVATEIRSALRQARDPAFQARIARMPPIFGGGGTSARIAGILREQSLTGVLQKRFHEVRM